MNWILWDHKDGSGIIIDGEEYAFIETGGANPEIIAYVNIGSKQGEDNVRLISSAPELLAALESLMPLWARDDVTDTYNDEFKAAQAAIAKAKGE